MKTHKLSIIPLLLTSMLTSTQATEISARVVGGVASSEGSSQWMVYVQAGPYSCGGTLIDENTVLTAAHCLFYRGSAISANAIFATVGEYDLSEADDDAQIIGVSETYVHRDYNSSSFSNDIALLRLSRSVTNVTPIERLDLSSTVSAISNKDEVKVIGWGTTTAYAPNEYDDVTHETTDILREATLPLQTDDDCGDQLLDSYDNTTMLCAAEESGGTDSCQGDSGGPLLYDTNGNENWQQIGIVSWGYGCAEAGSPGVYTRLAVYDEWIKAFTEGITIDTELNFANIAFNDSDIQTIAINNQSQYAAQLTFSLDGSADFFLDVQNCESIEANTSCSVSITYSPSSELTTQAELTIYSDLAENGSITTTITGTPLIVIEEIDESQEDTASSSSSSGGGGSSSLLFIFALPLLLLRRFLSSTRFRLPFIH